MKMIKFSRYVVLGAALAVVTGCNDAKLSTIDNGVYIACLLYTSDAADEL